MILRIIVTLYVIPFLVFQFAEKQELDRIAQLEEDNRRQEAAAEEEALRSKPKSKLEEVAGLLAGKLAERLELSDELLLLLRRSHQKASDSYHVYK